MPEYAELNVREQKYKIQIHWSHSVQYWVEYFYF